MKKPVLEKQSLLCARTAMRIVCPGLFYLRDDFSEASSGKYGTRQVEELAHPYKVPRRRVYGVRIPVFRTNSKPTREKGV